MTPLERAEKIADELWKQGPRSHLNPKQVKLIAAQIEEAEREAHAQCQKEIDELSEPMSCGHATAEMQPSDEGHDMCIGCYLERGKFEEGFSAAREKAKGIVRTSSIKDLNYLADRISRMEVEK